MLTVAGSALQKIERIQARRGHKIKSEMAFTVKVERDEIDGGYVAECLELPGCLSQGETEEEALENIVDAITGVLEAKMQRHLHAQGFEFDAVEAETVPKDAYLSEPHARAIKIPVA
jgi:predicted RNase H-like HicB family nuclease